MEKDLQQLKDEVTKLRNKNISHEDMGVQNNFIEAENIKNEITQRNTVDSKKGGNDVRF